MEKEMPMLAVNFWKAVKEEKKLVSGKHLGSILERRGT